MAKAKRFTDRQLRGYAESVGLVTAGSGGDVVLPYPHSEGWVLPLVSLRKLMLIPLEDVPLVLADTTTDRPSHWVLQARLEGRLP